MSPILTSDSNISCHQFQVKLQSISSSPTAFIQVLKFADSSCQIWIGDESGTSSDLAVAFPVDKGDSKSTKFLGHIGNVDDLSENLAAKLSKKLSKPVFVGFNAQFQDPGSVAEIQKRILREIKDLPEKF